MKMPAWLFRGQSVEKRVLNLKSQKSLSSPTGQQTTMKVPMELTWKSFGPTCDSNIAFTDKEACFKKTKKKELSSWRDTRHWNLPVKGGWSGYYATRPDIFSDRWGFNSSVSRLHSVACKREFWSFSTATSKHCQRRDVTDKLKKGCCDTSGCRRPPLSSLIHYRVSQKVCAGRFFCPRDKPYQRPPRWPRKGFQISSSNHFALVVLHLVHKVKLKCRDADGLSRTSVAEFDLSHLEHGLRHFHLFNIQSWIC